MMKKGLFITIEGPDGAGKSTQIEFIKKYFEEKNIAAIFTREPGGTIISEKIRSIILDKSNSSMSYMTEALLYAASRAQLVEELIIPTLNQGVVVICDRFVDSSVAYQGYGRALGDKVGIINSYAVNGCMPDMTLLLRLDSKKGINRIETAGGKREEKDRMESESISFHQRVLDGYLELEKRYPDRIKGIDASQSIEEVSSDIKIQLDKLVKEYYGL